MQGIWRHPGQQSAIGSGAACFGGRLLTKRAMVVAVSCSGAPACPFPPALHPRWRCFLNPDLKRPCDEPLTEWEVAVIVEVRSMPIVIPAALHAGMNPPSLPCRHQGACLLCARSCTPGGPANAPAPAPAAARALPPVHAAGSAHLWQPLDAYRKPAAWALQQRHQELLQPLPQAPGGAIRELCRRVTGSPPAPARWCTPWGLL